MQFGIIFDTHVDKWDLIRYGEELGYDAAWVPDSQMIWSDCYATMALAAVHTKRIKIGTGVAIAGTRIAPVTAHSIASINQLAPGRVFLGIGTGHTAMRVMGQDPVPIKEFHEYLCVVRALLEGKEADYTYGGKTRQIKFLHRDRHFINLDNQIPIYVAANGPLALKAAGAYGDGWMTVSTEPLGVQSAMEQVKAGAKAAERSLPAKYHTACVTSACVLRPGDKETARFRQIHDGHCTFLQPEERRFVTPEAIRNTCIVGTPEEIISRLKGLEQAGVNEIVLLPPADYQRKVFRDFAEIVMPAFR